MLFSTSLFDPVLVLLLYLALLESCAGSAVISALTARLLFSGLVAVVVCWGDELREEEDEDDIETEPLLVLDDVEDDDDEGSGFMPTSRFIPTSHEWSIFDSGYGNGFVSLVL